MAELYSPAESHDLGHLLERIQQATTEDAFSPILYDLARAYAPALGIDFDTDVYPNLDDPDWWIADYGISEVDGKAIGMSIKDAFRCLVDTHRTWQLSRGIQETIRAKKELSDKKLTAIDAGTGTGILSILLLAHGVDTVYAIEYNHQTYEATKAFLHILGLDTRITLIEGDATNIPLEAYGIHDADLLVSENLSAGLLNEPQYAIISHISKYLADDAEIIPYAANLAIAAGYADWDSLALMDDAKHSAATRRLSLPYIATTTVPYAQIVSTKGMQEPVIHNDLLLINEHPDIPINTLFLSTRFVINRLGEPIYLEPDAANFLGNDYAFKIDTPTPLLARIPIQIKYLVGRKTEYVNATFENDSIHFSDNR